MIRKLIRLLPRTLRKAARKQIRKLLIRLLLGKDSFVGSKYAFFEEFEEFGIHVLTNHYYSPVPDTRALRRNLDQWYREWSFTGVNFDMEGQLRILKNL